LIRIIDFTLALVGVIFLSPLLIIVSLVLRFTGEQEIFYVQNRVGKMGNKIKILKFATMLKDSANMGTGTITIDGDPRILKVGVFLRKTKINELPQLLNVISGDLSLVGPRPLTTETFNYYDEETKNVLRGYQPGISGLGSLVLRNEEDILGLVKDPRTFYREVIAPYKGSLELWFLSQKSMKLYFILIFLTIYIVLTKNNKLIFKVLKNCPKPKNLELRRLLDIKL